MENDIFLNNVKNYNIKNPVRFHMPGHKGKSIADYQIDLLPYDITELIDTDNLYSPEPDGGIRQAFNYSKNIYGTVNTIFSAGGATLCIQTAVMSVIRTYGTKRIICDRRCHKSVINALMLCDAEPIWIDISNINITELPDASAMIITSPDYYGRMYDLKKISYICHEHNILLICDNAHGSHLTYYNDGVLHPYNNGADIVIDSLHKTLPALTGAALLHTNDCLSEEMVLSSLRLFASTSPSYLISMSICTCLNYMSGEGKLKLHSLYDAINNCKIKLRNVGYNILDGELYDPFRLCIKLSNAGELYEYLYDNNVVCEFYDENNVIIIPSIMNTPEDFNTLVSLCKCFRPYECDTVVYPVYIPQRGISARESLFLPQCTVKIDDAINKICADIYAPYPPGIPLIIHGELFDSYIIKRLKSYGYTQAKINLLN